MPAEARDQTDRRLPRGGQVDGDAHSRSGHGRGSMLTQFTIKTKRNFRLV